MNYELGFDFEDVVDESSSAHFSHYMRLLYDRLLAEKDTGDPRIDYSVLSVCVLTLGLILVVEVLRHRIDHAAIGRPFFKAVMEGVYSECKFYDSGRLHGNVSKTVMAHLVIPPSFFVR
jgi:hypothetical protein